MLSQISRDTSVDLKDTTVAAQTPERVWPVALLPLRQEIMMLRDNGQSPMHPEGGDYSNIQRHTCEFIDI